MKGLQISSLEYGLKRCTNMIHYKNNIGLSMLSTSTNVRQGLKGTDEEKRKQWPEPTTQGHMMDTSNSKEYLQKIQIQRIQRDPNESRKIKEARLIYQSRKRGILEMDLILSTFASEHLKQLNDQEIQDFEKLLEEYDWDLYYWLTGEKNGMGKIVSPPENVASMTVFQRMKKHASRKGEGILRMPDL